MRVVGAEVVFLGVAAIQLPAGGEDALVLRPALQVMVRRLPPGGASFVKALMAGVKLSEATATALDQEPAFDLVANLAGLMRSGALVDTL